MTMRGFVFTLDALIATLIALIILVTGLNYVYSTASQQRQVLNSMQLTAVELSDYIIYSCPNAGGVAHCTDETAQAGEFDEVAMQNFQLNEKQKEFLQARNLTAEVTFKINEGTGQTCVARVGKKWPSTTKGIVKVCIKG